MHATKLELEVDYQKGITVAEDYLLGPPAAPASLARRSWTDWRLKVLKNENRMNEHSLYPVTPGQQLTIERLTLQ